MNFGLLGRKLHHSLSPKIHGMLGNYKYDLFCKEPEELKSFLNSGQFDGLNVTIPYKLDVIPFCHTLSDTVKKIGSANTIVKDNNDLLHAHNTDYFGFKYLIKYHNFNIKNKKALILGSGGSSLTVKAVLNDLGAREIITVSRTGSANYKNIYNHDDAEIIINTTPVGMYPEFEGKLIELERFKNCFAVIDLIYNPMRTELLIKAKELSIPYTGGMLMLVAQAFKAAELFTKQKLDETIIEKICSEIIFSRRNIVLIGMPGSGKSSIASELFKMININVIDTDEMIKKSEKMKISDIFNEHGEDYFRKAESKEIISAAEKSGNIISVGGGAVLSKENRKALMRNSIVFYIKRDINKLSLTGRPLSKNLEVLKEMEKERAPLYNKMADIIINAEEGNINSTAKKIKKLLQI